MNISNNEENYANLGDNGSEHFEDLEIWVGGIL